MKNRDMNNQAFFKVDTKLAELLGETYRSSEYALKELIDNAYDADAENVKISLPDILKPEPKIVIIDDGSGMKEKEVRGEYLNVASSRRSRKGDLSSLKKRKVKGRKGIGKFSGLLVAYIMNLSTYANGIKTNLTIDKSELAKAGYDLEKVPLPIETEEVETEKKGTEITLLGLNQNLDFPNPDRLGQLLIRDYGREDDFHIYINEEKIGVENLQGATYEKEIEIDGNKATLIYTITSKPIRSSGIVTRVNNKIIGSPNNYLSEDELIPKKLQNRVYGEIICDDLEDDVTADHGAIIENSKLNKKLTEIIKLEVKDAVDEVFATDMKMARARYQRKINQELSKLPEYKKSFAKRALYETIEKFYGESEDKINTVITVMVSALEKDHYWDIIQNIQETDNNDIEKLAGALSKFGLLEMSIVSSQAINRLKFLDELNLLVKNKKTLEKDVHEALEKNTWVFGDQYGVIFSDKSFKSAIQEVLGKKYKGKKGLNRPDLLLGRKLNKELVLIEFKRPDFTINRDTERQALEYKDELNSYFHNQTIEVILIGGKVKQNISSHNERDDVKFTTYLDLISQARNRLEWLIEELKN